MSSNSSGSGSMASSSDMPSTDATEGPGRRRALEELASGDKGSNKWSGSSRTSKLSSRMTSYVWRTRSRVFLSSGSSRPQEILGNDGRSPRLASCMVLSEANVASALNRNFFDQRCLDHYWTLGLPSADPFPTFPTHTTATSALWFTPFPGIPNAGSDVRPRQDLLRAFLVSSSLSGTEASTALIGGPPGRP
eukprot:CAMPEP_0180509180 /NCGR_PEP_ID=MMETSP1036_2-20121128/49580_1 /TAXON_ID=632150 /ORGANISM="Azadinium spinosum, Strain 3D9" /LENGTH=191 /DNA_ID=CAMNT_0022519561 /DNA_START=111 /DNA_END=683 /DNA_ORIENTATION=-